jgi:phage gpG-like protein
MIKIDIDDREVRDALSRLSRRLSDMQPVMVDIAQVLESETERRFKRDERGLPSPPSGSVSRPSTGWG